MALRLVVRGYLKSVRQWERSGEVPNPKLQGLMREHATGIANGTLDMIEIEFLDEPDVMKRFFRIGSNPDLMVMPIKIGP
jgi:hypothetical protein